MHIAIGAMKEGFPFTYKIATNFPAGLPSNNQIQKLWQCGKKSGGKTGI